MDGVDGVATRWPWRSAALVVGCVLVLAACTKGSCTLVGCAGGVSVNVSAVPGITPSSKVRFCLDDGRCVDGVQFGDSFASGAVLPTSGAPPDAVSVTELVVTGESGQELYRGRSSSPAHPKLHSPNGPECGPTCWGAAFVVREGTVEPVPS